MNDMVKNLVLWLVIAAVLLTVFNNFNTQQKTKPMDYSQFIELVQSGQVKEVAIDGLHFDVTTSDVLFDIRKDHKEREDE